FLQKKHFLDNASDYLKNKLAYCKGELGRDHYYRDFLCPLFFEGFAKQREERSAKARKLLGEVPYLNGGIFMRHQIETLHGKTIEIPDEAFERLFAFFDAYHWHLDERPLRRDNEINPDVLGYIFEKYVNQKEMGAYYTKEDITGYIGKNTIIPFLFDAAREKCKIAFEGDRSVWRLLQEDPDRYIYDAVMKGIELPLPSEIADGLGTNRPNLLERRKVWNKPAPTEYALPTEIWREVVARRGRYEEVRGKLANGEVRSINDLITYNLDIRQFAQDVIENCEGPELLVALWKAVEGVTVLDPTCGSGAFLFAALNILDPLYEACLERMRFFLEEWGEGGRKNHPNYSKQFTEVLKRVDSHPNYRYFVLKSIIVNNLYGVDIMDEAVEICRLRLFLKLVAQIECVDDIEPLPDIDFNIRAGNTLVGFVSLDEVRKTQEGKFALWEDEVKKVEEEAEIADRAFRNFQEMQTRQEMMPSHFAEAKENLHNRLKELRDKLDLFLAAEYGVGTKKRGVLDKWQKSHQPFHWFIEFNGILHKGGFDVIIGNPPYIEYRNIRNEYKVRSLRTEACGDLYAFILEKSISVLSDSGRCGLIVPVSFVSTDGFAPLRNLVYENCGQNWFSTYAMRPSKLFNGAEKHLCIWVAQKLRNRLPAVFSTKYNRWSNAERDGLFSILRYVSVPAEATYMGSIPKIGSEIERSVLEKILSSRKHLGDQSTPKGRYVLYHTRKLRYFVQFIDRPPMMTEDGGKSRVTSELKEVRFSKCDDRDAALAIYCSTLFFWYFLVFSDCRNLNKREVAAFPFDLGSLNKSFMTKLSYLTQILMENLQTNSQTRMMEYEKYGSLRVQVFAPRLSKTILDEIDKVLATHYAFTDEELDFVINYDIKYRMGLGAGDEGDE
ncbi:MAG: N-6 DNA methylase, partial [candidate division Zixibacteria bacterium]|nr:N-6 DNA methylase [candidate division Zixibacteria bacterium]